MTGKQFVTNNKDYLGMNNQNNTDNEFKLKNVNLLPHGSEYYY